MEFILGLFLLALACFSIHVIVSLNIIKFLVKLCAWGFVAILFLLALLILA